MKLFALVLVASAGLASTASAQSLVPLATFGVNGWRAPGTVVAGDAANTTDINGVYLGLNGAGSNTERGMAYNRATGNLILVTRNGAITAGATQFRVLDSVTGRDTGGLLNSPVIAGGTFAINQVGVSDTGQIFVTNLSADIRTGTGFRVYSWANESAAPALHYSSTSLGAFGAGGTAPRLGDSFDVIGSGANTRLVAGFRSSQGYLTITGDSAPVGRVYTNNVTPTAPAGSGGFTAPAGAPLGRYGVGITFAGDSNTIWGKVTGGTAPLAFLSRSTIASGNAVTTDTSGLLASAGESLMDFARIDGQDFLATLDTGNGRVYIYNVTNPALPVSVFTFLGSPTGFSAIPGSVMYNSNGNASGSVQWGAINDPLAQATLYVLSSNNGIQAFTFTVPTPGAMALLGLAGLVAGRRRR